MSKNPVQVETAGASQSRESNRLIELAGMLIFLPVYTFWFHFLLKKLFEKKHFRPHILAGIVAIVSTAILVVVYFGKLYDPTGLPGFSSGDLKSQGLVLFIWAYIMLNLLATALVTPFTLGVSLFKCMKRLDPSQPYRWIPENWAYNWVWARTPLEKLRRKKNIEAIKTGKAWKPGSSTLGIIAEGECRDDIAYRLHKDALMHTMITGGSGSGKTFTTYDTVKNSVENGFVTIYVDFKRTNELSYILARMAKENGQEFYHFLGCDPEDYDIPNSDGPCAYDPLNNGGTSVPDMLVNMRKYNVNSDHYKSVVKQVAQAISRMLRESDPRYFLEDGDEVIPVDSGVIVMWAAAVENLDTLYYAYSQTRTDKGLPTDTKMARTVAEMKKPSTNSNTGMETIRGSLNEIVNSIYGQFVDMSGDNNLRVIDLNTITSNPKGAVVLFSFNADSEKVFAEGFGSLIMQDISNIAAIRRNSSSDTTINLFVDEFQAVPPSSFDDILAKGRASKIGATFIAQSLSQIALAAGDEMVNSVLTNCSTVIALNGSSSEDTERLAGILGKKDFREFTRSGPPNRRTSWEKMFVVAEDDSADTHTQKIRNDYIVAPEVFHDLKKPSGGNPPVFIVINKNEKFDDGNNFILVEGFVSNDVIGYKNDFDALKSDPKAINMGSAHVSTLAPSRGARGLSSTDIEPDYIEVEDEQEWGFEDAEEVGYGYEPEVYEDESNSDSLAPVETPEEEDDFLSLELEGMDFDYAPEPDEPEDVAPAPKFKDAPREKNPAPRKASEKKPGSSRADMEKRRKKMMRKFD